MLKDNWKKIKDFEKSPIVIGWHIFLILLFLILFYFFKIDDNYPSKQDLKHEQDFFGVTFSKKYCEDLGLDWKEVYLATIDELKVKEIRLPIYWDEIEKTKNVYDFSDYDYIIQEGEKRDVKFIVNLGWRLPRWPECHAPAWATNKTLEFSKIEAVKMIQEAVAHYKDNKSIIIWQLENEPFFDAFGVCPDSDEEFFKKELAAIKAIDDRPVLVSASGELSFWKKEAKYGDLFGTTLYRVVWGKFTGYIRYPFPSWFYGAKAKLAGIKQENAYIVELQAEPWVPSGKIIYLSPEEEKKSFSIEQFRANLQYSIDTKFSKSYLWGVEWWYHKHLNGDSRYWDLAKTIF